MRAMTVRFPAATCERLEREASTLGISAAQFVREATLARIAYIAGRRGEEEYASALRWAEDELQGIKSGPRAASEDLPAF